MAVETTSPSVYQCSQFFASFTDLFSVEPILIDELWELIYGVVNKEQQIDFLSLNLQNVKRFSKSAESYFHIFQKLVIQYYDDLKAYADKAERHSKQMRGKPTFRLQQGDILLFEAFYYLSLLRLYQLKTRYSLGKYSESFRGSQRGVKIKKRRVMNSITIINDMKDLLQPSRTDHPIPTQFYQIYSEIEKMELKADSNDPKTIADIDFAIRTKIFPGLYQAGLQGLIDLTKAQLGRSKAIYRQLGYQSRIAQVDFFMGKIILELERNGDGLNNYQQALNLYGSEIGYSLDKVNIHLDIAETLSNSHIFYSINSYLSFREYVAQKLLKLPEPFFYGATFRLANLMLNLERSPYPHELVLDFYKSSKNYFQKVAQEKEKFVDEKIVMDMILDCSWGLAEIYKRMSYLDNSHRFDYLSKAQNEIGYILKETRNLPQKQDLHNKTRLILAPILFQQNKHEKAIYELEVAISYSTLAVT